MPVGGLISGTGATIGTLLGSNKAPRAILNRYAAAPALGAANLAASTLKAIKPDLANAFRTYMAGQGRQEGLAAQQEGVLNTLLGRRLADDPQQNLRNIFQTAFSQIDPNVISPLAQFDVNSNILAGRARGINTGAVDSTAERLRNARVASGRYYDVARNVYNVVPQLYNSAYAQGAANDAAAAGFVPGISAAYEAVASRPTQGILNRIAAARSGVGLGGDAVGVVKEATQGYKTPQNFWDRLGKAGQQFGDQLSEDEDKMMAMVSSAMSGMGSAEGGGGGGAPAGGGSMYGGIRPMQSIQTPTPSYQIA